MPVYRLGEEILFPPVNLAEKSGLLAVGGDLSLERVIAAYLSGIFPWYSEGEPILWYAPNPRFVLFPEELHISKSLKKILKKEIFSITVNHAFREVITGCSQTRRASGTWITDEMIEAYCRLYEAGIALSVEAWREGKLVGGLYGLILGKMFFGESMFSLEPNASKAAFSTFAEYIFDKGIELIDCQVYTAYLASFGAKTIERAKYMALLEKYTGGIK